MPSCDGPFGGCRYPISSATHVGDIIDAELHFLVAAAEAAHAKGAVRRACIRHSDAVVRAKA